MAVPSFTSASPGTHSRSPQPTGAGAGLSIPTPNGDAWRALSDDERDRRLREFRDAFVDAYASSDEYIAEKRGEAIRER